MVPWPWIVLILLNLYVSDASHFLSGNTLALADTVVERQQHGPTTRQLLQILKPCQVAFQDQNYTIITSVCKGPEYRVKACCNALVDFACPFASQINDNTTDCAAVMFSYINLYGHYPAGLFANLCTGDANGLPCPLTPAASPMASHAFLHKLSCWSLLWPFILTSVAFTLDYFV